jgi:hypothetical protein
MNEAPQGDVPNEPLGIEKKWNNGLRWEGGMCMRLGQAQKILLQNGYSLRTSKRYTISS